MGWLYQIDAAWTLFLDRDGVINARIPGDYVRHTDNFTFLPGSLEAFYLIGDRFYKTLVVTNQAGIGKGLMSHDDLTAVHEHLRREVAGSGGQVDDIYYSTDARGFESYTRKPAPGMAIRALADYPLIDFKKSIMVGDMQSDIDFGRNLGMKTVWIDHGEQNCEGYDIRLPSLLSFARMLS